MLDRSHAVGYRPHKWALQLGIGDDARTPLGSSSPSIEHRRQGLLPRGAGVQTLGLLGRGTILPIAQGAIAA